MGSKKRIAKYLLPILLKDRKPNQTYVEPFCGGCNIIDKVSGKRIANDEHFYLIEMFKALQNNWIPPKSISIDEYNHIRDNKNQYPSELVGYVGFNSYAAKWFGGYCRDKDNLRNYSLEYFNNIMKQMSYLKDVVFYNLIYQSLQLPEDCVIYCDPPYKNTTSYKNNNKFNHDEFWNWVRKLIKEGHNVFVSEYEAPDDFKCIWSKEINNTLVANTGASKGVEKLFVKIDK